MLSAIGEDLIRFVVLIIPGLWALWVYKPFLLKSTEAIKWEKDIAVALSFSLPGYLLITSIGCIARAPIPAQFTISLALSLVLAVIAGKMFRRGIHPFHIFAKRDSQKSNFPEDVPYCRGLAFILDNLIQGANLRKGYTAVALVYNLGNREKALIGEVLFEDGRFNEVVIDARPEITLEQIEKNHWDINPWTRSINLDSGLVVEVANVKNEIIAKIHEEYDYLMEKKFRLGI